MPRQGAHWRWASQILSFLRRPQMRWTRVAKTFSFRRLRDSHHLECKFGTVSLE
jgi:hypothetical protein